MKKQLTISGLTSIAKHYVLTFALALLGIFTTQNAFAQESIVVELTTPIQSSTHIVGFDITISASATADSGIERVNFKVNGDQIKSDAAAPYSTTWTPTETGTYSITCVAVDNETFRKTSEAVTITVVEASEIKQTAFTPDETPHQLPNRIEFEHYDNGGINVAYWDKKGNNASDFRSEEMVDISTDGTKVRDIKEGEWLEYTIEVPETGDYDLLVNHQTRRSPAYAQLTVSFIDEGITFESNKVLTNTGSESFMTEKIGTYTMEAGVHVLRFSLLNFGFDVDYFVLNKAGATYEVTFNDGVGTTVKTTKADLTVDLPDAPTNPDKTFKHWETSDGQIFDENTVVTADMEVTVVWDVKKYTLNITSENGTVAVDPEQDNYEENTEVTLTATADEFYEFESWTGDYEGTENPLTVTVTKDLNITANFKTSIVFYNVTFNDGTNTVVVKTNADGTCELPEQPVQIENNFQHWETSTGEIFDETTVVTEDMEVTAVWAVKTFSLTVNSDNGTVAISPEQDVYEINTEVTLTATGAEGYSFVSWSGDYIGTDNPITVKVTKDMSLTAIYETVTSIDVLQSVSNVYPNPSNGVVNIELTQGDNAAYKLYTLSGQLVSEGEFSRKTVLNVPKQKSGMYILEIITKQGVETKKILVE
ncbi:InlB B-repeat-containing protein [Flammeovirga pacifica]|nr:Ig-like domain-containing protein [Flammeovirga pacifica]